MTDHDIHRIGCSAGLRAWRREASALRILAENPALTERQRQLLLHEADAADRQADAWADEVSQNTRN